MQNYLQGLLVTWSNQTFGRSTVFRMHQLGIFPDWKLNAAEQQAVVDAWIRLLFGLPYPNATLQSERMASSQISIEFVLRVLASTKHAEESDVWTVPSEPVLVIQLIYLVVSHLGMLLRKHSVKL